MSSARIALNGQDTELPIVVGTEGEVGIDIGSLRSKTGAITLDPGFGNTGSCESAVTFIDGERGILRYRGYPIGELAEKSSFVEVAYLLIYGELPSKTQLEQFRREVSRHTLLHEDMKKFFEGYPPSAHPMSVLSAMVASLSAFYPESDDPETLQKNIIRLLAKLKTIAAVSYKKSVGQPVIYPRNDLSYAADFLHQMFAIPTERYEVPQVVVDALDLLLILHADHEQNCSTSTVRMVGSSGADLFVSISAGIGALSGPLHGRANQEVIQMLELIHADGGDYRKYMDRAKDKEHPFRLMGFGHRVYKNYDPRAKIMQKTCHEVLAEVGHQDDPLLQVAMELERVALHDDYFIEKKLYPNIDFYSGITLRAMGFPTSMFTVLFAVARTVGWIAQWKEMIEDPQQKIGRPRQLYTGPTRRDYVPISTRKA